MKLSRYIAAGLLAAGTTLALAAPVSATEEAEPICGTWTASEFIGSASPTDGALSVEVNAAGTTATLKRSAVDRGVEFLRTGLDLEGPLTVSVVVSATETQATSGAVRIFGYASKTPNTLTDAPTYGAPKPEDVDAVATGTNSPLTLVLEPGEKLGALGFTWDASNPHFGDVTFGPATVDNRPVSFKACPDVEESPDPEESPDATTPPVATGSPSPTAVPTLPKTGVKASVLGGIAGAVVLAGLGIFFAARGRRHRFEA